MSEAPRVKASTQRPKAALWIVPLVAVFISGYLIYENFEYYGVPVTIRFENADGISPDKTLIKYRGVPVGKVTDLSIEKSGVAVQARLNNDAEPFLTENSAFYLVSPEVGLGGVKALGTIFSGPFINLVPGEGGPAREFQGHLKRPGDLDGRPPGLPVVLRAGHRSALNPGDGVFFRGMKVGEIYDVALDKTSQHVMIKAAIAPAYDQLVRQNSKFWKVGHVRADIGIFGGQVEIPSFDAFFKGGVEFATPTEPGDQAPSGFIFRLYLEPEKKWAEWSPQITE